MNYRDIRNELRAMASQPLGLTHLDAVASLDKQLPMAERIARFYLGDCEPYHFSNPHLLTKASPEALQALSQITNAQLGVWPEIPPTEASTLRERQGGRTIADLYDVLEPADEVFVRWSTTENQEVMLKRSRAFPHFLSHRILVRSELPVQLLKRAIPERLFRDADWMVARNPGDYYQVLVSALVELGWWILQIGGGELFWMMAPSDGREVIRSSADRLLSMGIGIATIEPIDETIQWSTRGSCPWLLTNI